MRTKRKGLSFKGSAGRPKGVGATGAWSKGDNEAYEDFKRTRRELSEKAVQSAIVRLRKDREYRRIMRRGEA